MTHIKNRPLNEFELDCVVLSLERLRKEPRYLELLEQRKELQELVQAGTQVFIGEVADVEHEIGYWEGKFFSDLVHERTPRNEQGQFSCKEDQY